MAIGAEGGFDLNQWRLRASEATKRRAVDLDQVLFPAAVQAWCALSGQQARRRSARWRASVPSCGHPAP